MNNSTGYLAAGFLVLGLVLLACGGVEEAPDDHADAGTTSDASTETDLHEDVSDDLDQEDSGVSCERGGGSLQRLQDVFDNTLPTVSTEDASAFDVMASSPGTLSLRATDGSGDEFHFSYPVPPAAHNLALPPVGSMVQVVHATSNSEGRNDRYLRVYDENHIWLEGGYLFEGDALPLEPPSLFLSERRFSGDPCVMAYTALQPSCLVTYTPTEQRLTTTPTEWIGAGEGRVISWNGATYYVSLTESYSFEDWTVPGCYPEQDPYPGDAFGLAILLQ